MTWCCNDKMFAFVCIGTCFTATAMLHLFRLFSRSPSCLSPSCIVCEKLCGILRHATTIVNIPSLVNRLLFGSSLTPSEQCHLEKTLLLHFVRCNDYLHFCSIMVAYPVSYTSSCCRLRMDPVIVCLGNDFLDYMRSHCQNMFRLLYMFML